VARARAQRPPKLRRLATQASPAKRSAAALGAGLRSVTRRDAAMRGADEYFAGAAVRRRQWIGLGTSEQRGALALSRFGVAREFERAVFGLLRVEVRLETTQIAAPPKLATARLAVFEPAVPLVALLHAVDLLGRLRVALAQ